MVHVVLQQHLRVVILRASELITGLMNNSKNCLLALTAPHLEASERKGVVLKEYLIRSRIMSVREAAGVQQDRFL